MCRYNTLVVLTCWFHRNSPYNGLGLICCLIWLGGHTTDDSLTLESCLQCKRAPKIGRREAKVGTTVLFLRVVFMLWVRILVSTGIISVAASSPFTDWTLSEVCKEGSFHIYSCGLCLEAASPHCFSSMLSAPPQATDSWNSLLSSTLGYWAGLQVAVMWLSHMLFYYCLV